MPADDSMKYAVIEADGKQRIGLLAVKAGDNKFHTAQVLAKSILGGWPEHVRVFWPQQYCSAFVDEDGVGKELPVNDLATKVYHNNLKVHAPEELKSDASKIHGTMVIFLSEHFR